MSSWVRYSVAVYVGLLISGALAQQPWQSPKPEQPTAPSVSHEAAPAGEVLPLAPSLRKPASNDVSV